MEVQRLDLLEFSSSKRVETTVRMASNRPLLQSSQLLDSALIRPGWGMKPLVHLFLDKLPGTAIEMSGDLICKWGLTRSHSRAVTVGALVGSWFIEKDGFAVDYLRFLVTLVTKNVRVASRKREVRARVVIKG
jgi:hypothetical protein